MIARTARLVVVATEFGAARANVERIVRETEGFIGHISVGEGDSKALTATLQIPEPRLDAALTALKTLGRVAHESQQGDDVTAQVMDLDARLSNSRNTEKRLVDILATRTGTLADVLAAEQEVARVRGEIERLESERKNIGRRVTYAAVSLEVSEERKASLTLGPLPVSARFRNALVDGSTAAFQSVVELFIVLVRVAPLLVVWGSLLGGPALLVLRSRRRKSA